MRGRAIVLLSIGIWILALLDCKERSTENPLWPSPESTTEARNSPEPDAQAAPATAPETPAPDKDATVAEEPKVSGQPIPTTADGQVFSFADLVERTVPAVVNISTTRLALPRSPEEMYLPLKDMDNYGVPSHRILESLGSGFIIDEDGYILTSLHVVASAESIRVRLHDGREFDGRVIGRDPKTDIALLKIDGADNLTALPFGDSSNLRVGDWVIAIGNPFGLSSTVTAGIISAVGRDDVSLAEGIDYSNFIQTDASINPGNSGGPLLNVDGRVIGINVAINRRGQGIGFAIPINMARAILPQLNTLGWVARSYLGVYIDHFPIDVARMLGWDKPRGALIDRVIKNGPADLAGLLKGDIIVIFDGTAIEKAGELPWLVSTAGIGKIVKVVIMRGRDEREVEVVMGKLPE